MTRLCTMFSGSRGNSTYLEHKDTTILIDAGVSCKAVTEAVKSLGKGLDSLSGIVITHEHIDHIRGLRVITKRAQIPLYATSEVLHYLVENDMVHADTKLIPIDSDSFTVGDIEVNPFKTSHDSVGSRGYRFNLPTGVSVGFATDLGVYTKEIEEMLLGCKAVVLESNYDDGMLSCSSYPYVIKRRIKSHLGHLSNIDCAAAAKTLVEKGTEHLILAHLSEQNNVPGLAFETTKSNITQLGAVCNKDYTLQSAPVKKISEIITL